MNARVSEWMIASLSDTVDGSEIRLTTWDVWNPVNNGINYPT